MKGHSVAARIALTVIPQRIPSLLFFRVAGNCSITIFDQVALKFRIFKAWHVSTALPRQAKVSRGKIDLTFVDLDGQAVRIPEKGKAFIGGFIDANGFDPNPEAA